MKTVMVGRRPRFVVEESRRDEYVLGFGAIRSRRPLRQLARPDRQELLRCAAAHLEALAERMRAEAAELDG